jgi:UDP-xylose/UDP-N-acetylglucosamine transporter B4
MAVASPVAFVALATPIGLIFGGCCSNVYALEAIIQSEPDCGTLITFAQFLFVASTSYVAQFNRAHPPFFLTPTHVPLRRWFINILLFFSVNILNNYAFSFNISVPMHIILRSGGSVTTMLAGVVYGKRYTHLQFLAVFFLTSGICLAAWSDANSKVSIISPISGIYVALDVSILESVHYACIEASDSQ